jgi:hypothetical protein
VPQPVTAVRFCLLINPRETDKGAITMRDDWELVDKCVHAWHDLKQNAIMGNCEAASLHVELVSRP